MIVGNLAPWLLSDKHIDINIIQLILLQFLLLFQVLMHLHHHFNSSTIILSCALLPRIRVKASADQLSFTVNWMRRPGYYNNHIKKNL